MNTTFISNTSHEYKYKDTSKHQALATGGGKPLFLVLPLIAIFTIALTGCGRGNAGIKLPDTEVLVSAPIQQDVPVHNEWVATMLKPGRC